jgi:hypothetical protein
MVKLACFCSAGRSAAGIALGCTVAAALAVPAVAADRSPRAHRAQVPDSLRLSPELWATIDVCNPTDQPYTVGIRGSMPGDGQSHDTMMMRFRLQYLDTTMQRWTDLAGAASEYLPVGSSRTARQAGRSFVLYPPPAGTAFMLRGVINFQWRRGSKVLATISRATKSGHQSLAGADPPSFSAATCRIV